MKLMSGWLRRDSSIRILSVVIAVFIWFQVMTEENPTDQRTFDRVAVEVKEVQQGCVVLDYEPKTISVVVRGSRRGLTSLAHDRVKAQVKLNDVGEGRTTVPIEVGVPSGFEVAQVLPALATVAVDVLVSRPAKVKVDVSGSAAEDFEAMAPALEPSSVTVSGPKSKVVLVDAAWGRVDVSGATADVKTEVQLFPVTSEGREVPGLSLLPRAVKVVVPVRALPPAKTVVVRAAIRGSVPAGYKVDRVAVEPDRVRIRAPAEVLAEISSISTVPVSIEGMRASGTKEVGLVLPPGVVWSSARSAKVSVDVSEDISSRTFKNVPVVIRNISVGLRWKISPDAVDVVATGRRELLEGLEPRQVEAFVDVLNLAGGLHSLPVQVGLKGDSGQGETRFVAEPGEVAVELREL